MDGMTPRAPLSAAELERRKQLLVRSRREVDGEQAAPGRRAQPEPEPPKHQAGLAQLLRTRDMAEIAMRVLHDIDHLGPLDVPGAFRMSEKFAKWMHSGPNPNVPEDFELEWETWHRSTVARANAKAENLRRLSTTLWAEQCLRELGRDEHEVLRAFNRDCWLVPQPAAADPAGRDAQARERA